MCTHGRASACIRREQRRRRAMGYRSERSSKRSLTFVPALVVAGALSIPGCSAGDGDLGGPPLAPAENLGQSRQAATLACQMGPENTNAACSDGISNDGDSFIDCD